MCYSFVRLFEIRCLLVHVSSVEQIFSYVTDYGMSVLCFVVFIVRHLVTVT